MNKYKILFTGETDGRNGNGVILDGAMKAKIVEVIRISDPIIVVKSILEKM